MDVFKTSLGLVLLVFLTACGSTKSTENVYRKSDSPYCEQARVQTKYIVEWEDGRFSTEHAESEDTFKKEFLEPNLHLIKSAEPDYLAAFAQPVRESSETVQAAGAGNDSWGQSMIETEAAWSQGFQGQGILVGIVDSYVDTDHPQLKGNIAVNTREIPGNGIDDDKNGYVDDVKGYSFVPSGLSSRTNPHGTHVSGIIAADPQFGPVRGVAPKTQLIPAPFISSSGEGSLGDAILALQYVASRGAKIINASWGGAPCVSSLQKALTNISSQGILLVVAAGNSGLDIDRYPVYPAAFATPTQITVAASTILDFMPDWSNNGYQNTHLAAPGSQILSTVPGGATTYMDGTSMAAPFVSGAAALVWSSAPQATAAQVRSALLNSVDVRPGHEFRVASRGRLNVRKAIEELRQLRR